MYEVSTRANILTRRTYNRPLNEEGDMFEDWEMSIDRVIGHQQWLWERALTHKLLPGMPLKDITPDMLEWVSLNPDQLMELSSLRELMLERKALPSGRTLWLGGTEVSKTRESSMFNCSHSIVETVYDVVDLFWLLLQGCGVGITPRVGSLTGFRNTIPEIEVIRSTRTKDERGREHNEESFFDGVWTISVGDSAEAWAKSIGKILIGKNKATKLILDFSEIRGPGKRLRGYGWLSSGDEAISKAYPAIATIMNKRAGSVLRKVDIIEIMNYLGTVLSSRRCLPEDTSVYTDNGIKPIKHINIGDNVYNSSGELKEVTNTFYQGEQSTIKLKTRVGIIECTDNHKIGIVTSPDTYIFKEAKDITIDDKIAYPEFKMQGSIQELPKFENISEDNRAIVLPNFKLDEDFSWFIGYFLGNGCVIEDKCISVAVPNEAYYFDTVKSIMNSLVSERKVSVQYPKENDNCYKISIHSINLAKWFKTYIKPNKGSDMRIPSFIKNSDKYIRSAFLAGLLDSDGSLKTRPKILAMSICEYFILEVQELYSSLGILTIKTHKECNEENWSTLHYIKLIGNHEIQKFEDSYIFDVSIKVENDYVHRKASQNDFGYQADWLGPYKKKNWDRNGKQMIIHRFIESGNMFNGIIPVPVEEILDGTTKNTYDIEVADGHEFIAGDGWLSHNSAEITFVDYGTDEWEQFAKLKTDCYEEGKKHKQQSNNSLVFNSKPTFEQLQELFNMMIEAGGSEPGLYNMETGRRRAPYATGSNPCGEILLPSKGFCNLVEVDIGKFKGDSAGLHTAYHLIARANYRQTCVDLDDGILSEPWNSNNKFLRLCGVGATGIATRDDLSQYDILKLRDSAVFSARTMAKELGTEFPKAVTTVKPSGTLGKIMDTTEGIHMPEAKYLFNWVNFSNHDPLVMKLKEANYRWLVNPADSTGTLINLPVKFDNVEFSKKEVTRKDGTVEILEVNAESAIQQLERYRKWQTYYCDQNVSNTIYYIPEERDDIVEWLLDNWEVYVGVSFLPKNDPTLSPKDFGYDYLPQEYVSKENFYKYFDTLVDIDWNNTESNIELEDEGCATGACPIK